jgi:hypothetical protein
MDRRLYMHSLPCIKCCTAKESLLSEPQGDIACVQQTLELQPPEEVQQTLELLPPEEVQQSLELLPPEEVQQSLELLPPEEVQQSLELLLQEEVQQTPELLPQEEVQQSLGLVPPDPSFSLLTLSTDASLLPPTADSQTGPMLLTDSSLLPPTADSQTSGGPKEDRTPVGADLFPAGGLQAGGLMTAVISRQASSRRANEPDGTPIGADQCPGGLQAGGLMTEPDGTTIGADQFPGGLQAIEVMTEQLLPPADALFLGELALPKSSLEVDPERQAEETLMPIIARSVLLVWVFNFLDRAKATMHGQPISNMWTA